MLSMLGKIHLLNIFTLMNQDANTAFAQIRNVFIALSTIGKRFLKIILVETALNNYTMKSNV